MKNTANLINRDALGLRVESLYSLLSDQEMEVCNNIIKRSFTKSDMPREDILDIFMETEEIENDTRYIVCRTIRQTPPAVITERNLFPTPLTVEQLKNMPGEPVWVYNGVSGTSFWMLAYEDGVHNRAGYLKYDDLGKVWNAWCI